MGAREWLLKYHQNGLKEHLPPCPGCAGEKGDIVCDYCSDSGIDPEALEFVARLLRAYEARNHLTTDYER